MLHPHVGTMVENPDDVQRVLDGSAIALCLDTGHLLIGGTDPAELTRQVPDRIAHTHMKDVDSRFARPRAGRRADLHRGRPRGHVPAAGLGRRRRRRDRGLPGGPRLRRLVRPGAGHDPAPATRRARARSPTSARAWSTCAGCSRRPGRDRSRSRIGILGAARITELSLIGPRADHRRPARGRRRPRPVARRGVRGAARRRAGRRLVRRAARRPRGRGRLQPAGERAARAVEPRRRARRASTC